MNTTTQPETADVTVEKIMDWAISSQASHRAGKVQRPERKLVGTKRFRSAGHLLAGEDMVRADVKASEESWTRTHRNYSDFDWTNIPATNLGMDVRETLEGLIKRPVV